MFVCHSKNDSDKLDPETAHSEGLGTRIYQARPGASCQFPEMLSMPGEAIYRGDVPFLLNVNHKHYKKKDTSMTFWAERNFFCHTYDTSMMIIVTKPGIIIDVVGSYFYDKSIKNKF